MYIYVANETMDDIDVYFDNLTINHTGLQVVESTDYYPYGMVMRKELPSQGQGVYSRYRHGYQGQFAEKDEETDWNHFELREYGSRIGRWTATDPYRQYASPYTGMGNNPIKYTDPRGAWTEWGANFRYNLLKAIGGDPGDVYESGGEWGFNSGTGNGQRFVYGRTFNNTENTKSLIDYQNNFYGDMRRYSEGFEYWKWVAKSGDASTKDKNGGFAIGARAFAGYLPPVSITNAVMVLANGEDIYGNQATSLDKSLAVLQLATSVVPSVGGFFRLTQTQGMIIEKTFDTVDAIHTIGLLEDADGR